MIKWKKYTDLEPFVRLRYEGRELLGKEILFTEKRDGSNISLWLDEKNEVHISSHNLEIADESLTNAMKSTPEYPKIVELLKREKQDYNNDFIAYGELLLKGKTPTRIELPKKKAHWILFDMWVVFDERYLDYSRLYQYAYQYKIPIVKVLGTESPTSLEELQQMKEKYLKWCKAHKREGVVGKNYPEQIFFKEKIDLPKIKRIPRDKLPKSTLPPMPEEKILRALQHAYDELNDEDKWRNPKYAMPIVAKHISTEATEHYYEPPRNFYGIYLNTPIEKIKHD